MDKADPITRVQGCDFDSLRALIVKDLAASNELGVRITELRNYISQGNVLPAKKIDLMEASNKDKNRDLVARIERIESSDELTATDREMLQALNSRLAIGDRQAMQLAELRDVEYQARRLQQHTGSKPQTSHARDQDMLGSGDAATLHTEPNEHVYQDIGSPNPDQLELDDEPDGSSWPLLYRILRVDPELMDNEIGPHLQRAQKRMALKHNPKRFPNDTGAPARWAVISKAYDTLSHPGKRQWYDAHGNVPPEIESFDIAQFDNS